jgi:hypothetical protein
MTKMRQPKGHADPTVIDALAYNRKLYNTIHTRAFQSTTHGHWVNEAFIVRLYAILEAHGVVSSEKKIDPSLPGAADVDICRRLRHEIAHATGHVSGTDAAKLYERVVTHYDVHDDPATFRGQFRLPKDKVLRPMDRAVVDYCTALLAKERASIDEA